MNLGRLVSQKPRRQKNRGAMSKERRNKLEEPTIASMGYNTGSRGEEEGREKKQ